MSMEIVLRRARPADREAVLLVERKSMPTLQYLPSMFEEFMQDDVGDFSVEEVDGVIAACGKYTIVPDGSVWLETLRVTPERQGIGLGKRLYEHWHELAKAQGVRAMRMYTGVFNAVSSGLAERYGLRLQGTFNGYSLRVQPGMGSRGGFRPVRDPEEATRLLMPIAEAWGGWMVMNRTFYRLGPELCAYLTSREMVYKELGTSSVIALGARFMSWQALHVGAWGGDANACLNFALWLAGERSVPVINCLHESSSPGISDVLSRHGFKPDSTQYVVKGIDLS